MQVVMCHQNLKNCSMELAIDHQFKCMLSYLKYKSSN